AHGDPACIHHTFTHAKALATVLDRGNFADEPDERLKLPRDEAYGLKSFPVIGTRLEDVQAGSGGDSGGGHATGGALSQLYHCGLGPILVASMTKYAMIEMSNQQQYRGRLHMTLTPRIECAGTETYTSLDDLKAEVTAAQKGGEIVFDAKGRMLTTGHKATPVEEVHYRLAYKLSEAGVDLTASVNGVGPAPMRLIM